jgi:iron complex transport system ATP-binding protein
MLKITQLDIKRQEKSILNIDSVNLICGQRVAILGPNGAGKSSLLKAISGEWSGNKGDIYFHDTIISQWSRVVLAKHLGVMPQASQIDFPFSVHEVVAIGATPLTLKKSELNHKVKFFLSMTDTWQLNNKPYAALSGGEKQRVQLARILLQLSQAEQAPLLLLDEPTSAQDLGHQHQMMALLSDLTKQQSYGLLCVLHDLNIANRYSDAVWLIDNQKLVVKGPAEQVLTPDRVNQHWQYFPEKISKLKHGFGLL